MVTAKSKRDLAPAPRTLMQAHDLLTHMRPKPDAAQQTWLTYYRRSAAIYAEVAEVDRGHHHEALYWATRERRKANDLAAELAKPPNAARPANVEGGEEPPPETSNPDS